MKIVIKTIPHIEQRYETVGDWWFSDYDPDEELSPFFLSKDSCLNVRISDTGNEDYNHLIAMHEIAEALLCRKRNITQEQVTEFDRKYEKARIEYPEIFGDREPGDHPSAPYVNEHMFASRLEQSMALELGVDWQEYNRVVNEM